MPSTRHIVLLILKEYRLELRRKSVIAGLGLYLLSLVFVCYITLNIQRQGLSPSTWSAIFWLIILFSIVNTVAKSFIGEKRGATIYFYTLANPIDIIISKMIYNASLTLVMAFVSVVLMALFISQPVQAPEAFYLAILLSSIGLSSTLTLISGIASKANNSNVLMAVLSFPIVLGILLMAIRATKNAVDGLELTASYDEFVNLFAIDLIVTALACVLFPFVWRS